MRYSESIAKAARKAVAKSGPRQQREVEALLKTWCAYCALSELAGEKRRDKYERTAAEMCERIVRIAEPSLCGR